MKVAIGARVVEGAWGGGNQFVKSLAEFIRRQGDEVAFDLGGEAPDIILVVHPLPSQSSTITIHEAARYVKKKNRNTLIVLRINNTSQAHSDPKGWFNKTRICASRLADHTIFISSWLRDIYFQEGLRPSSTSVILNGGDTGVFKPLNESSRPRKEKIHLVTHHWSPSINKGFDIYSRLDHLLEHTDLNQKISFTYIGRVPDGFTFRASTHYNALPQAQVAEVLPNFDIYLTAARHEGAGMHHIEGALCGLPVLYINSGALPEYCKGYGVMYEENTFEEKLSEMVSQLSFWKKKMKEYPHTAEKMGNEYAQLLRDMVIKRNDIRNQREDMEFIRYLTGLKSFYYRIQMKFSRI
jgi:hypothetical protein